jgi:hypothetical protein
MLASFPLPPIPGKRFLFSTLLLSLPRDEVIESLVDSEARLKEGVLGQWHFGSFFVLEVRVCVSASLEVWWRVVDVVGKNALVVRVAPPLDAAAVFIEALV